LIARKDPRRHPRVAARWLCRYLEERPEATIAEAAMAPPASPHSAAMAERTPRRHSGPWPKERLGDGEAKA
jgi:hypothetical protein